jgi:putative CocE/NonD family hydrolase
MKRAVALSAMAGILAAVLLGSQANRLKAWVSDLTLSFREGIDRSRNVMIPMRDGIRLATDIYRPAGSDGPYPVIYIRTTYGGIEFSTIRHFVKHGYAVAMQHVRGRYGSEGQYRSPYWTAGQDGYDTIEWLISQPWATDRIGTFGCSYLGESQIILAAENHPSHVAMIASGAGGALGKAADRYGYFGVFENGVLNLASSLGWFTAEGAIDHAVTPRPDDYEARMRDFMHTLPVSDIASRVVPYRTGFGDFLIHPLTDPWWDNEGYIAGSDTFSAATLHINDWFDQTAHNTFYLANHMANSRAHPRARFQPVIMAPGGHCDAAKLKSGPLTIGDMTFDYTAKDFKSLYLTWFDYWLKDAPVDPDNATSTTLPAQWPAAFEYFLIHGNQWEASDRWPPDSVRPVRYWLADGQQLRSDDPATMAALPSIDRTYRYNPGDPVPTVGGPICCTYRPEDRDGPMDQTALESRQDVLVFETEPLAEPLDLIGNARVVLFVSTDAPDTDFTVKLIDQYPDGPAFNLQDGVVRLRYRDGIANPGLAEPGTVYQIELELRPLAYRFRAGHRIKLHVSSSNFPRLARNLNTGLHEYTDATVATAENRVYLQGDTASYLELPVRPARQPSKDSNPEQGHPDAQGIEEPNR